MTGDIGTSPIAATAITGFALTLDGGGAYSTSPNVPGGKVYAANYAAPTPAVMTAAILAMEAAYNVAAGVCCPLLPTELDGGIFPNGKTLYGGGGYKWSTVVTLSASFTLNFDAQGDPNAVWIMQIAGGLNFMAGSQVVLQNGAKASNIFWQVAGEATIGAGPSTHTQGVILGKTGITMTAGGELTGCALAQSR